MRKSKPFAGTAWSRLRKILTVALGALPACLVAHPAPAQTEAGEIRIAYQYGLAYLPLLVAADQDMFGKALRAAGLEAKVTLLQLSGAPAVSEAVLSGNVDLGTYGTTGFLTAWDKTRGNLDIKGLCAVAVMQSVLLANRPDIRSIRDFKPEDRISVPATVSPQAVILRMAAEQAYGPGQYGRLDSQMVVLPHPEGLRALVNRLDVVAQVTSPPFDSLALEHPGIHRVLTSDDVLGGPSTFILLATTGKFAERNPKTMRALLAAMEDAMAFIKAHRDDAARIYLKSATAVTKPELVEAVLADPANDFVIEPLRVMKYAEFMGRIGALKHPPQNWRELFLPLIADRNGS